MLKVKGPASIRRIFQRAILANFPYGPSINYILSKSAFYDPLLPFASFLLSRVYSGYHLLGYPPPYQDDIVCERPSLYVLKMSLRRGMGSLKKIKTRNIKRSQRSMGTYLGITKNLRNSVQKIFESILIGEIFNHRAGTYIVLCDLRSVKKISRDSDDKVHVFWEGHKILRNLHLTFVCRYSRQK